MQWPAPGKINRFLHITGQRADGYHLLQTLFQFISLQDSVRLDVSVRGAIERARGADGVRAEDDLAVRAARALRAGAGTSAGVVIEIEKNIPMGGGLGGGSSDAATVLVALNHLWDLHWPLAKLARLGLELGADVPVFVHGLAAWAEGVGDVLTPVQPDAPTLALLTPDCAVDTGRVFSAPALTRDTQFFTISRLFPPGTGIRHDRRDASEFDGEFDASDAIGAAIASETRNDCVSVARALYPPVARAMDLLEARVGGARLTGTGASVFAPLSGRPGNEPGWAATGHWMCDLPAGWRGFIVRTLNRSPLHDAMAATGCKLCARLASDSFWGVAKR